MGAFNYNTENRTEIMTRTEYFDSIRKGWKIEQRCYAICDKRKMYSPINEFVCTAQFSKL